jgi:hypothetical protein
MRRNLQTVTEFSSASPFSEGQLRWFIFNSQANGLAKADAIVRVGRRVYVDVDNFEGWINAQNQHQTAAA